jgi:hypothetical protein
MKWAIGRSATKCAINGSHPKVVIRIPAREVLMSPDKVAENLLRHCKR